MNFGGNCHATKPAQSKLCCNKQTPSSGHLEQLKRKWRQQRPAMATSDEITPTATDFVEGFKEQLAELELAELKSMWRLQREGAEARNRVVSEVVNKRGRKRNRIEYECRWVSLAADNTSWEYADTLDSAAAQNAVAVYEEKVKRNKSRTVASVLCAGFQKPICTRCCNTVVEVNTYNEKQELCLEVEPCMARRKLATPPRATQMPSRFQ